MSLTDRLTRSDDVSYARVSNVSSEWRGGKIFTKVEFDRLAQAVGQSEDYSSGDSGLVITMLGGQAVHPVLKTPVIQEVAGFVRFAPGDEVVVFSRNVSSSDRLLVGGQSGVIRVTQLQHRSEKTVDAAARQLTASRATQGVGTSKPATRRALIFKPQDFSVQDYLNHVRKMAAEQKNSVATKGVQP